MRKARIEHAENGYIVWLDKEDNFGKLCRRLVFIDIAHALAAIGDHLEGEKE